MTKLRNIQTQIQNFNFIQKNAHFCDIRVDVQLIEKDLIGTKSSQQLNPFHQSVDGIKYIFNISIYSYINLKHNKILST